MIKIIKTVYEILDTLNSKGYEGYLVGGAVRNTLLKLPIDDYDITTNASPNEIKDIFKEYTLYKVGEKHGTIAILKDNLKIEITTFRSDLDYKDHRHPESVIFTKSLEEDLKRRDFTINALCLDKKGNLIDKVNGLNDLNNKIIRTINDPKERFNEDALRILRALRFSAKFNFNIEDNTKKAMFKYKDLLSYISNERKKEELLKILSTKNNLKTYINDYLDIYNTFIPFKKVDDTINNFSNPYYSLAYLLSKTNNYDLKELKFSKKEINLLNALIKATNTNIENDYNFIDLLSNTNNSEILLYLNELYNTNLSNRYKSLKAYMVNKKTIKLNGEDLLALGYKGKEIKKIQEKLIELIKNKKLKNIKVSLLKYLKKKML